jgi:hypothetical protein
MLACYWAISPLMDLLKQFATRFTMTGRVVLICTRVEWSFFDLSEFVYDEGLIAVECRGGIPFSVRLRTLQHSWIMMTYLFSLINLF